MLRSTRQYEIRVGKPSTRISCLCQAVFEINWDSCLKREEPTW